MPPQGEIGEDEVYQLHLPFLQLLVMIIHTMKASRREYLHKKTERNTRNFRVPNGG